MELLQIFVTVRKKKGCSITLRIYLLNTRIDDNMERDLQKHLSSVCFKNPIYRLRSCNDFTKIRDKKDNVILVWLFF